MKALPYILIPIILVIIIYAMQKQSKRAMKTMTEDVFIVSPPKLILWISLICLLFFTGLLLFMALFSKEVVTLWGYLIFVVFLLLSAYLFVYALRWRIEVNLNVIRIFTVFGKPKEITFFDISGVKMSAQGMKCYAGEEKLFSIDTSHIGYRFMLGRIQQANIAPQR